MQLYRSEATKDYRGTRDVHERHRQHPVVRAVPHGHGRRVHDRRRQGALRPHGSAERRRATAAPATSISAAGRSRPISCVRASTFRRRRTSSSTARSSTPPAGRLHRDVPPLQGRPRAEGHVRQPAGRRERLAVSRTCADRCCGCRIGSRSPTRRASSTAARARFDYRMAPFGQPTPARATWDVDIQGRRSRRGSRTFSRRRGCGWPAAPRAATVSSGRSGSGRARPASGEVTVAAPADVRPMTRELPADLRRRARRRFRDEAGPFNPQLVARLRARSPATSLRARSAVDSRSRRAGWRPAEPTSSSKGGRRTASSRGSRFT